MNRSILVLTAAILLSALEVGGAWRRQPPPPSPIDRYIEDAAWHASQGPGNNTSPGSLYGAGSRLSDLFAGVLDYQVDDLITVVVSDRASAIARGVDQQFAEVQLRWFH